MPTLRMCARVVALAGLLAASPAALAQMTPISAAGWNRDIVVERTATTPFSAAAQNFDAPNNYAWYEQGLPAGTKGLPQGGAFTSAADGTTQVQFQPYAANNALFLNSATSTGTLTLLPAFQRPYTSLAIFAASANASGTATGNVTLNFADSTSTTVTYNAFDWFFVTTNNAINDLGRLGLAATVADDGSAGNPRIYQTTLTLSTADANKTLVSLTFTRATTGATTTTAVMAISGLANAATSGTCCSDTGQCSVTSPANCTGAFHSEWATCAQAQCPQPAACCFADGHCAMTQSAACTAQSGTPGATGSTCSPNTCPQPGACCFDDGSCVFEQESACTASTGGPVFHAGTACTSNPCPALPFACCLTDGSCLARTQAQCTGLGGTWYPSLACSAAPCTPPNLLVNPGAETNDMSGWTVDTTGGAGWVTDFDTVAHTGSHAFATSYALSTRHQTVDLLAAGFTPEFLDAQPTIQMSEWVASRFDQGAQYFVRYELLDANMQVVAFFEQGQSTALLAIPANTPYFQVANTFTSYGAGVRFLNIIDGGRDQAGWAGNYGAHFDDALAAIVVPGACCVGAGCQALNQADCITASGTFQSATSCSSNPCGGGGGGTCCRGATCTTGLSQASCTTTGLAGAAFASSASECNSASSTTTPCCYANYNKVNGITVQDIFDFLGDWFAGSPYARVGSNGSPGTLAVQNIFDFLNAWFSGGCQ